MSFDYVNGLMQDAVNYVERELGNQCDREKIHDILSFLTTKTMELRCFLYGIPPFTPTTASSELADKIKEEEEKENEEEEVLPIGMSSETQQIILKKWETLDDKVGSVCFIITSPQALKLDFHLLLLSHFYLTFIIKQKQVIEKSRSRDKSSELKSISKVCTCC